MDGALINGNLFDILVAPSYFTIQPVRSEITMSALPPKADIAGRQLNVRFVPKVDIYELPEAPPVSASIKKSDNVGHHDIPTMAEPRADRFCLWMLVR